MSCSPTAGETMLVSEKDMGQELAERFKGFKVKGRSIEKSLFFKDYQFIGSALTKAGLAVHWLERLEADFVGVLAERVKKLSPSERENTPGAAEYFQQRRQEFD